MLDRVSWKNEILVEEERLSFLKLCRSSLLDHKELAFTFRHQLPHLLLTPTHKASHLGSSI